MGFQGSRVMILNLLNSARYPYLLMISKRCQLYMRYYRKVVFSAVRHYRISKMQLSSLILKY
jgi:hypothetical protein